ncbi:rab-like protein 3 [Neocloeon triangulifer]|uniref:rab-like protein 3 n=1 Tax=Neocloeon triangulifer TaxID=2078957 RepID=UPI00286F9825|nr:rab-like protein 3 [Neocloeon triangulifer]XP_059470236.1 rab-like protein 3 [Neocloeon triangulifer]XP_059470237.1 rab-like protein 3 [Neocloeon triangulifer]XP_059470238.1 rab-like protein 3 [Neocloeon triangulifer]XP_059470239.1 rab-like protein 3 [Neocloeon triangulifer]
MHRPEMASMDKVRVIVVGDSGVGKTSLVHLMSHGEPLVGSPPWTVGCSVEVKLHEFREGTPAQKSYFVEFWDIGGSSSHRNARNVFYNPTHGIILVHDLSNRKSHENLRKWLAEVLNRDSASSSRSVATDQFDPEQFVGSTQIPILVIGTKSDLVEKLRTSRRSPSIAEECGADEIVVDCHEGRSLAAGSSAAVKLARFFDKVIERKYQTREARDRAPPFVVDSRRSRPYKGYHND